MKFQQVTGRGRRQRYRGYSLLSLQPDLISSTRLAPNPNKFGTTVEEFISPIGIAKPPGPLPCSRPRSHDSKRSEDVRARINALSEFRRNGASDYVTGAIGIAAKSASIDAEPAPTRNDEYLLYQTLVGTWPTEALDDAAWGGFCDASNNTCSKRRAKPRAHQLGEYQHRLRSRLVPIHSRNPKRTPKNQFLPDFAKFAYRISRIGIFNSLSQSFLK